MKQRMRTHAVRIGSVWIGADHPIAVQSMCSTRTSDVESTAAQIHALEEAGCEIVRVAVPDEAAAESIRAIRDRIRIPLVADIHFSPELAIRSIRAGADKVRINPGNIGGRKNLEAVVQCAADHGIPIRVGVNSGSLEKEILEASGGKVTARGLVQSALDKCRMIEEMGYGNLVISIKASDVPLCVEAHEQLRELTGHPLHIGITEAGTPWAGNIKSAVGLGILLHEGIGDTIRVSLTGDPVQEVKSGLRILRTLGLRKDGIEVISCPTCGRTAIDLCTLAEQVNRLVCEEKYSRLRLKVACMGCAVNGPGEAAEADLAVCGGKGEGLIIRQGKILRKVPEEALLCEFAKELDTFLML